MSIVYSCVFRIYTLINYTYLRFIADLAGFSYVLLSRVQFLASKVTIYTTHRGNIFLTAPIDDYFNNVRITTG